ncbi:MAG TPA: penicillin-binding transpeptidase domain-containing protein [Bacillota bacterium]|nr:penicillin-binding transpeptidase domain-containing protein [Bacillota bacterium]
MRKTSVFILFFSSILFLITACSKEQESPDKELRTYIDHWSNESFEEMYNSLSEDAKSNHTKEDFTERYEKVYTDMEIHEIEVTYDELTKEEIERAYEEGTVTIPFQASMTSLAGPISFDYEAELQLVESDDDEKWVIDWNPGFIFPALKDGGKISFQSDSPERGSILDRDSIPLAMNDVVYEIGIIPEKLPDDPSAELTQIANILEISVSSIEQALSADWVEPGLYVPITKVPKTNEDTLVKLWDINSIERRETDGRVYPLGKSAAHLVGYVGDVTAEDIENAEPGAYGPQDVIGKRGLEYVYEETLKGERGIKIIVTNEDEEDVILAEKPTVDGEDVKITINSYMQKEIYESYGKEAGTAAAIDPKTGEALALVSSPSFDPHDFAYGIGQKKREELESDGQQPLLNRFTATYAPGSVMKPISAAIGLKDGSLNPDEGIEIKGLTWDNGWKDYQVRRVSESSKPVDLADALKRSDNIYFAMKAIDAGIETYTNGLENFGFGQEFPFPYPYTASSISADGTIDNEVLLANSSYGQGEIEISALHLAIAYTPFLNEGNMLQPTLLTSEKTGEIWKEDILSKEDAKIIEDILFEVVDAGTAKKAQRDDFDISGKTGTAELKVSADAKGHDNGWFVGYPTEDQDILIAMMVEKVEDLGASGYVASQVADLLVEIKKD